jgi:hypothetical protein
MLLWTAVAVATLAALGALLVARRVSKRLDSLTHSYWELRYEQSRVRALVARLDPESAPRNEPAASAADVAFVPLSSLKPRSKKSE